MTLECVFGSVLKSQRMAIGLSQEKLALLSGLDRTFISLLERGKRSPSLKTLFILSQHLSLTPLDLIRLTMEQLDENNN